MISRAYPQDKPDSTIELSGDVMRSLAPSKVFRSPPPSTITSIDFYESGEWCVLASTDDTLKILDCKQVRVLNSKKYGCDLARYTHHRNQLVYASTKENDTIRYLSIHDNSFIRYFKGHESRVNGIEMAPMTDQFLSSSVDGNVRLWDLKTPNSVGQLELRRPALVQWDQGGQMFAVACRQDYEIRLFNLNGYGAGPFSTYRITHVDRAKWTSLKFSNTGQHMLLTTDGDAHYLLNALNGEVMRRLQGHVAMSSATGEEVAFTPDGKYVVGGSDDGSVCVWDVQNGLPDGSPIVSLEGHTKSVTAVGWNPQYAMMVTACSDVCLWQPDYFSLDN